jgi:hypothetical protein
MMRLNEPAVRHGRASSLDAYETDARVLHVFGQADRIVAIDLIDVSHARALRDGCITVAASEPTSDLHVEVQDGLLDMRASAPCAELRLEGAALHAVRTVRANGRELRSGVRRAGEVLISGADWAVDARLTDPSVRQRAAKVV